MSARAITYFDSHDKPKGVAGELYWDELIELFEKHATEPWDASGYSLVRFEGDYRKAENVLLVYACGLDFDAGEVQPKELHDLFADVCSIIHTTRRHTPEKPRCRVQIMYSRPVTAAEHKRLWPLVAACATDAGYAVDEAPKDPCRFWFWSCANASGPGEVLYTLGQPIDVDAWLARADANEKRAGSILANLPASTTARVEAAAAVNVSSERRYSEGALRRACDVLRGTAIGERNTTLTKEAYAMGGLVGHGRLTEDEVRSALVDAISGWDPDNHENQKKTLERQLAAGMNAPRVIPEREQSEGPTVVSRRRYMNTDLGNAERLVDRHGADLRFVPGLGWFVWNGKRWERDETGAVVRMMKKTARSIYSEAEHAPDEHTAKAIAAWAAKSESRDRINAAVALASTEVAIVASVDKLDADPYAFNCQNGTIDLRTGELRPHRREDLITKIAGTSFDPKMPIPIWTTFLERVLPDPEVRTFIQRWFGYCLTASAAEHCLLFAYGTGRNGKGVCLITQRKLMGEYAVKAPRGLLVAKRNEAHPTELMVLRGARVAWCSEIDEKAIWDEAKVKDLASEDPISAHLMRCDHVEFNPTHKLNVAGNYKPKVSGTDEGIWSRLVLVPYTVTIPEEERDVSLAAKLESELPGILAWAVEGCREWQRSGLGKPKAVVEATATYRGESDSVGRFLTERCFVPDPKDASRFSVGATALYQAFVKWCEEQGERSIPNQRRFGEQVARRNFERKNTKRGVVYIGLGLPAGEPVNHGEPTSDMTRVVGFS